ncbi:SPL family radical SAM protein [Thermosulfurimonas dismutans]|uniref:Radical SAM domain protein n=1 Tax=Thermosulfurimonas dismutans TaxID=999894 RepID=A0A179D7T4_9BACT|nr:radical SAM protein [Thermosulfurimonas dismutans]OAQ21831.1 Radical SAM domain protein [Thermosulfurimonas dismutans]
MYLRTIERKTPVLKKPAFGCLKGTPSINLTRGCLHACVYCYARAFPETPDREVWLYANLSEKLKAEIQRLKLRGKLPATVTFSTASDLFQPHPEIKRLALEVLRLVLSAGLRVSFLTKGFIPEEAWALFADYPSLIKPRIGLVSVSRDYHRLFEPRTAPPPVRLAQLERLVALGLNPSVRVDPVIPGLTDQEEALEALFRRLSLVGAKEVSVSYLVLRPGVIRQMARELPNKIFGPILKYYKGQPWQKVITSATTKLAKRAVREEGFRRIKDIASHFGLTVRICGCKNPDFPFEACTPWEIESFSPELPLFQN